MFDTRRPVALAVLCVLAIAGPAAAQDKKAKVTELVGLLSSQPDGMDAIEWKEQRREAARQLGDLGDTRAVPALIQVVEKEEFDIVGEYAIVSLGKLGDDRAVDVLRRVVADRSREKDQRRAARKALKRLGADASGGSSTSDGGGDGGDGGADSSVGGSDLSAGADSSDAPGPKGTPEFDEDTLAAGEMIRFALGGLSLQYDTIRDRPTFNGDVAGSYEKRVDKKRVAWRYGADAAATLGFVNFDGDNSSSRAGTFSALISGEGRVYLGDVPIYAGALGAAGSALTALRVFRDMDANTYELLFGADLQAGVTVGYGRVLDVGEAIRLRRIEQVLRETKTLGRAVTPDLAERVLAAWWSLRGELGAHRRLVVTVKILRETGVLLGEPSASVTYKLLQVLLDGQLTHRISGLDVGIGIVESFVVRDDFLPVDDGRAETFIGRARFGKQTEDGERQMIGSAFSRYRLFAGDEAAPWSAGLRGDLHAFFYGDNYDPIGAIEIGAEVGVANDDVDDSNTGSRIAGTAGWRWTFNRASSVVVAGQAAFESGELFLGITLAGNYGFLDAGFVGASSLPAAIK